MLTAAIEAGRLDVVKILINDYEITPDRNCLRVGARDIEVIKFLLKISEFNLTAIKESLIGAAGLDDLIPLKYLLPLYIEESNSHGDIYKERMSFDLHEIFLAAIGNEKISALKLILESLSMGDVKQFLTEYGEIFKRSLLKLIPPMIVVLRMMAG